LLLLLPCLVGIGNIFGDGLFSGGSLGMFLAFMMMLCYSSSIVTIRSQLGLGGICKYRRCVRLECVYFSVGGRAPFVGNFAITHHDLIICPVLGVVKIGFGTVLMTVSAQHVPAAQVPLISLTRRYFWSNLGMDRGWRRTFALYLSRWSDCARRRNNTGSRNN